MTKRLGRRVVGVYLRPVVLASGRWHGIQAGTVAAAWAFHYSQRFAQKRALLLFLAEWRLPTGNQCKQSRKARFEVFAA